MANNKYYQNRGVKRNKTPLQNIVYYVRIAHLKEDVDKSKYEQYKYGEGYLSLSWEYQKEKIRYFHGFITLDDLQKLIGNEQIRKLKHGKREFIVQRRIDGKNI